MRALLSSLGVSARVRRGCSCSAQATRQGNAAQQHAARAASRLHVQHLAQACTACDLVRSILQTQGGRVPGQLQPIALCKGRKLLLLRTAALAHA